VITREPATVYSFRREKKKASSCLSRERKGRAREKLALLHCRGGGEKKFSTCRKKKENGSQPAPARGALATATGKKEGSMKEGGAGRVGVFN